MSETKLVLVVDDEADVRNYLGALLEDQGFRVNRAADGEEALRMVEAETPDLISLDLVMPGKSGAKFLYALRKKKEWQRIPVLVVTGHARDLGKRDLEAILSGRSLSGPATYLEKPVRPDGYVAAVCRQLGVEEPGPAQDEAGPAGVRSEIDRLLEGADPERMQEVLRLLRERESG
ncbi:MAG: response regulator [Planctomycetota bacterium]|jgi:CheY-like chemotaxis protein